MCLLLLGDLRDPRTRILGRHDARRRCPGETVPALPGHRRPVPRTQKYECNHVYQTPSGQRAYQGLAYFAIGEWPGRYQARWDSQTAGENASHALAAMRIIGLMGNHSADYL